MRCPELEKLETHLSQAKGLVFDCDGTLLDTMPTYYESWSRTCDEVGLSFPLTRFYEYAGMSVVNIFDILIKEQLPEDTSTTATYCEERKKHHHEQIMKEDEIENNHEDDEDKSGTEADRTGKRLRQSRNPPIEVVFDIVKKYHKKIPIGIASSGWKDHIIKGLEKHSLLHYFDTIVTADDEEVKNGKPHPDMYIIAAKRLGVDVEFCIGFEDANLGMEAIERAGYLYACDVRLLHDYPRNVEKRMKEEGSQNEEKDGDTGGDQNHGQDGGQSEGRDNCEDKTHGEEKEEDTDETQDEGNRKNDTAGINENSCVMERKDDHIDGNKTLLEDIYSGIHEDNVTLESREKDVVENSIDMTMEDRNSKTLDTTEKNVNEDTCKEVATQSLPKSTQSVEEDTRTQSIAEDNVMNLIELAGDGTNEMNVISASEVKASLQNVMEENEKKNLNVQNEENILLSDAKETAVKVKEGGEVNLFDLTDGAEEEDDNMMKIVGQETSIGCVVEDIKSDSTIRNEEGVVNLIELVDDKGDEDNITMVNEGEETSSNIRIEEDKTQGNTDNVSIINTNERVLKVGDGGSANMMELLDDTENDRNIVTKSEGEEAVEEVIEGDVEITSNIQYEVPRMKDNVGTITQAEDKGVIVVDREVEEVVMDSSLQSNISETHCVTNLIEENQKTSEDTLSDEKNMFQVEEKDIMSADSNVDAANVIRPLNDATQDIYIINKGDKEETLKGRVEEIVERNTDIQNQEKESNDDVGTQETNLINTNKIEETLEGVETKSNVQSELYEIHDVSENVSLTERKGMIVGENDAEISNLIELEGNMTQSTSDVNTGEIDEIPNEGLKKIEEAKSNIHDERKEIRDESEHIIPTEMNHMIDVEKDSEGPNLIELVDDGAQGINVASIDEIGETQKEDLKGFIESKSKIQNEGGESLDDFGEKVLTEKKDVIVECSEKEIANLIEPVDGEAQDTNVVSTIEVEEANSNIENKGGQTQDDSKNSITMEKKPMIVDSDEAQVTNLVELIDNVRNDNNASTKSGSRGALKDEIIEDIETNSYIQDKEHVAQNVTEVIASIGIEEITIKYDDVVSGEEDAQSKKSEIQGIPKQEIVCDSELNDDDKEDIDEGRGDAHLFERLDAHLSNKDGARYDYHEVNEVIKVGEDFAMRSDEVNSSRTNSKSLIEEYREQEDLSITNPVMTKEGETKNRINKIDERTDEKKSSYSESLDGKDVCVSQAEIIDSNDMVYKKEENPSVSGTESMTLSDMKHEERDSNTDEERDDMSPITSEERYENGSEEVRHTDSSPVRKDSRPHLSTISYVPNTPPRERERLSHDSSQDIGPSLRIAPSNDNDNFEKAREKAMQAMVKDKEDFFSEELPLSQKEILQSILLAEDAAINGQSHFSTKDKIHFLDKVHVPSLDEDEELEYIEKRPAKPSPRPRPAGGIRQRTWRIFGGFRERRSVPRGGSSHGDISTTSQGSNFI